MMILKGGEGCARLLPEILEKKEDKKEIEKNLPVMEDSEDNFGWRTWL